MSIFEGEDYILSGKPDDDIAEKLATLNKNFSLTTKEVFTADFCKTHYRAALDQIKLLKNIPAFQPYNDACTNEDIECGGPQFYESARS